MTVTVRPARSVEEFAAILTAPEHLGDVGEYVRRLLAAGSIQLPWCLVAERAGQPAGRLALWTLPGQARPSDIVLLDLPWDGAGAGADVGTTLLQALRQHPALAGVARLQHCLDTPAGAPQWQTRPDARQATLRALGLAPQRHTLRFRLDADAAIADTPPGVVLRPFTEADEPLLRAMMAQVVAHSADQIDRDTCARIGAEAHAQELLRDLRQMRQAPGWWQLASIGGTPAGFVLPTAGLNFGTVGYIGVLPSHRGARLVDPLLRAAAHTLRAAQLPRLVADTDLANHGMARAFERNGWLRFGERQEWVATL